MTGTLSHDYPMTLCCAKRQFVSKVVPTLPIKQKTLSKCYFLI